MSSLLGLESLPQEDLKGLLAAAGLFRRWLDGSRKKLDLLNGRSVALLFLEPSTRTVTSFDMAGKRLGLDTHTLRGNGASTSKGESLIDTIRNIDAMRPDVLVLRDSRSGAAEIASRHARAAIINAGDGTHEHPTQGLLDLLTLQEHLGPSLEGRVVTILGDISHSRVARSDLFGLQALGARVRVAGPPTWMPSRIEELGCTVVSSLREALTGADAIITLRIQNERAAGSGIPSTREYAQTWGVNPRALERWAKPGLLVLHPGPVNRGVELDPAVADGPWSVILEQVTNGVAVRMAALARACGLLSEAMDLPQLQPKAGASA